MWHEAIAGSRGANEISSCLFKHNPDLDEVNFDD